MRHHGVWSVQELQQDLTQREIKELVNSGELRRISRGWYQESTADGSVVRAIHAGGRLGCLSGCESHDLWVPWHTGLHVVHGPSRKPRPIPGIQFHQAGKPYPVEAVWPLPDCLAQVAHRHDLETGLIVLESAMHRERVDTPTVQDIIADLPAGQQGLARFLDLAESGSETRVRLFLQRHNFSVRPQVEIPTVGRVDLLVGDRLILECDSDEHHRTKEQHQEDRRRDLAALDLGLTTARLTYHQIWRTWDETQEILLRKLRKRHHISR